MDNKKKFAAICIGVLILAASVGTTLAYLGAKKYADNKIKVGTDIAEVSETFTEPSTQQQNNETTKEIKVKNTGSVPCFVRVYAEFSDSEIASIAKVNNDDTNTFNYTWDAYKTELAKTTNTLAADWQYIPESGTGSDSVLGGYFYYTKVVPVDNATSSLIKKVQVNYKTDNIDEIRDYEMIVYTETVQTVDTNGTEYSDNQWRTAWERFLKKTTP